MTLPLWPLWTLLGLAAGVVVRWGSVRLARLEELEPGFQRWRVVGPPVLCGLLFGAFAWHAGSLTPLLAVRSLWVALLVQVIFFDFEYHLILDRLLVPAYVLAILAAVAVGHPGWKPAIVAGLAAGLAFLLIALAGAAIFKAEALGFGDVKFAVFMGLVLAGQTYVAILTGVLLAGLISMLLVLLRLRSMRDSIAYGPFLAAGTLIELYRLGGH